MRILGLLLVLALSLGCAATPAAPERPPIPEVHHYAPLAVGASWTYAMNFQGQRGERTVRIASKNDEGFFVDDQGAELKHTREGLRDRQRYLIRGPLEVGATWKSIVSASAVEHYRVASVGEGCDSLAGRFEDCLVIEGHIRRDAQVTLHSRFVWARNVGLLKIETEVELAGKGRVPQTSQSLLRYALSGGPAKDDGPGTWTR